MFLLSWSILSVSDVATLIHLVNCVLSVLALDKNDDATTVLTGDRASLSVERTTLDVGLAVRTVALCAEGDDLVT